MRYPRAMPSPRSASSTALPIDLAPRFRRIVAWLTDLLLVFALAQCLFGLLCYAMPPDAAGDLWVPLGLSLAVGFGYLGFSPPLFGNTLGKWLLSIQVIGVGADRPPLLRWLLRLLLVGLWPVNGPMMFFGRTRRHLGDRVAETRVRLLEPTRNLWLGVLGCALAGYGAVHVAGLGMRMGALRMPAYQQAFTHLQRKDTTTPVAALPLGYRVMHDRATFDLRAGAQYQRVQLLRVDGKWQAIGVKAVEPPSTVVRLDFERTPANTD